MYSLMKKTRLIILVVVAVLAIGVAGIYNTLVQLDESVTTAWSQVENVYQRRLDLIPNLVNTVKGAAAQESGVLVAIVDARANATKVSVDLDDAQSFTQFQQAQGEVSSALSRLLAVAESYPTLQSIQAFQDLMTQLEGTENRITVERKNFNDMVNTLNIYLRKFPVNLVAAMFGFEKGQQFEAAQ